MGSLADVNGHHDGSKELATWVRTQGRDMIAVVLGAPTAATRFADVVRLVQKTTAPGFVPTTL